MYNLQGFLEIYSEKYKGGAQRVANFFENRELSCLLTDEIYDFFGTNTPISRTKFYVLKNVLIEFIQFVNEPNTEKLEKRVKNITQTEIAQRIDMNVALYRNLDEILDTLNKIVGAKGLHSSDASPLQSMAILIWYNYSDNQIINFRIEDIDTIDIKQKYKDILKTYAGLKYYRALPTGKVQNLLSGQYLFRTANTEQLTEFDIRKIISKINAISANDGKGFSRAILLKSRKFETISHAWNDQNITPDIVRSYFGQSIKKAEVEKTIIEYRKWLKRV